MCCFKSEMGDFSQLSLSVVIPAFNEKEVIEDMVNHTFNALDGIGLGHYEVVVVDDGSKDTTNEILFRLSEQYFPLLRVLTHERNLGYGRSLRDGFDCARYPLVFFTDADLQFDMGEVGCLLERVQEFDIVSGYRAPRKDPMRRLFISWVYNQVVQRLFGIKVRDVDCAFKVFHKRVLDSIPINFPGFTINLEILAKAIRRGYSLGEVPVTHYPRMAGSSTVTIRSIISTIRNIIRLRRELSA
jgi:glycosyltransferase involved in cell wall biosynthesis